MQNIVFIADAQQLKEFIVTTINEALNKDKESQSETRLFSRNQARIKLGINYAKLEKLIRNGYIMTTPDGEKISEIELNRYLKSTTKN